MTRSFPLAAVVVVLGTTAFSPAAIAQGQTWRLTCSNQALLNFEWVTGHEG
jgi:hypothetical protein